MQHLSETRRRNEANVLLESWLAGDADEQQDTGEAVIRGLEAERLSARHLYPPELKGISW